MEKGRGRRQNTNRPRGLSLVELLLVVAALSLLGLFVPQILKRFTGAKKKKTAGPMFVTRSVTCPRTLEVAAPLEPYRSKLQAFTASRWTPEEAKQAQGLKALLEDGKREPRLTIFTLSLPDWEKALQKDYPDGTAIVANQVAWWASDQVRMLGKEGLAEVPLKYDQAQAYRGLGPLLLWPCGSTGKKDELVVLTVDNGPASSGKLKAFVDGAEWSGDAKWEKCKVPVGAGVSINTRTLCPTGQIYNPNDTTKTTYDLGYASVKDQFEKKSLVAVLGGIRLVALRPHPFH